MKIRTSFMRGLLSAVMLTGLLAAQSVQPAFAAEPAGEPSQENPYTFTVTLSAGNQGTFGGEDKIEVTDLTSATSSVDFSACQDQLQLQDSDKYYAKGIRLSGRDNDDASYSPTWTTGQVTEDADYVVAYGMKGNMVAYTVQYLDEDGNELAPSDTFYGSIGDKPVVAYQYIEGYLPQAYNLTKTLSANEADNVFPFVYTPSSETQTVVETIQEGATVVTVPGATTTTDGTTTTTGTAAAGTTAVGAAAAGAGAGAGAAGGAGAAEAAGGETEEITDDEVPLNTVDLDEDNVPLGEKAEEDSAVRETSAMPIVLGIGALVVAAAAIVGFVIYMKKRSNADFDD